MPDVSWQAKATVSKEVKRALDGLVALRDELNLKEGNADFDPAERVLKNCREALVGTSDEKQIITILEKAHDALAPYLAGNAAPAVKLAQQRIRNLLASFKRT